MDYQFEFDPNKSQTNLEKHGIDFTKAQCLWQDQNLVEVKAHTTGESRYLVVAVMDGKHWSATIMYRKHKVRIISVRRSRHLEVVLYESAHTG